MIGACIHLRYVPDPHTYLDKIRIESTALGATDLIIIDETKFNMGSYFTTQEMNVHVFDKLEKAEEHFSDVEWVYLEPQRVLSELVSISLYDFVHPESCIYTTGADENLIKIVGRENKMWVHIPIAIKHGVFYAETTQILALYDRSIKS